MRLANSAVIATLFGVGLAGGADEGLAQLRKKSGTIQQFHGADNNDTVCTTSTPYKNLPSASVTFTPAGTDEAVVMFQGSGWFAEAQEFVGVRLTVNGVVQPGPGAGDDTIIFGVGPSLEPNGTTSHGFNFQTDILTEGLSHTVRLQWRSVFGNQVCVGPRSFIVLHQ